LREINNKKNPIPLRSSAYVELYNISELEETWEKFFASKFLYRYLMLSRASFSNKRVYLDRMHLFEKAFIEKKFDAVGSI
jgi:hypothetical protein